MSDVLSDVLPTYDEDFAGKLRIMGERSQEGAVSPAGARGSMQVTPQTSANPGMGVTPARDQSIAEYNRVGGDYARALLKRYGGNQTLASVAYNAGPAAVDGWIKQYGDPRSGKISNEDWLSQVPNNQARNYGLRVTGGDLGAPGQNVSYSTGYDPAHPPKVDLSTITSNGGVRFTVASSAAPQFQGLINDLEARGYKLDQATSGGYNPRPIAGTNEWSKHAYGTAIDVNWSKNPQGGTGSDIPPDLARELAQKYNLTWGGDWSGKTRDPMHFEIPGGGDRGTMVASDVSAMRAGMDRAKAGGTAVASSTVPSLHIVDNPLSVQQAAVKSALPSPTSPLQDQLKSMMAMSLLQKMVPAGHGLTPIDYDPYKVIAGSKMSGATGPTTPFQAYKVSMGSNDAVGVGTLGLPGQRLGAEGLMRQVLGNTGVSSPRSGVRPQNESQFGSQSYDEFS